MGKETQGFQDLLGNLNAMKRDLEKSSNSLFGKVENIVKDFNFTKEKKGKVNKKAATMFLTADNSVLIKFEDGNDGIKFFEGIK